MHIRPALPGDAPAITTLLTASWIGDELYTYTNPGLTQYPLSFRAYFLWRIKNRIITRGVHSFVCVSDDRDAGWLPAALASDMASTPFGRLGVPEHDGEAILGFIAWERKGPQTAAAVRAWEQNNNGIWERLNRFLYMIEGQYAELFRLDRSLNREQRHILRSHQANEFRPFASPLSDGKPGYWHLVVLATSPIARRKGVGRMLLQWGMDRAKDEGVPACCSASAVGSKLYSSAGFRFVGWSSMEELGSALVYDPDGIWTKPLGAEDEGAWFERNGQKLRTEVAWK